MSAVVCDYEVMITLLAPSTARSRITRMSRCAAEPLTARPKDERRSTRHVIARPGAHRQLPPPTPSPISRTCRPQRISKDTRAAKKTPLVRPLGTHVVFAASGPNAPRPTLAQSRGLAAFFHTTARRARPMSAPALAPPPPHSSLCPSRLATPTGTRPLPPHPPRRTPRRTRDSATTLYEDQDKRPTPGPLLRLTQRPPMDIPPASIDRSPARHTSAHRTLDKDQLAPSSSTNASALPSVGFHASPSRRPWIGVTRATPRTRATPAATSAASAHERPGAPIAHPTLDGHHKRLDSPSPPAARRPWIGMTRPLNLTAAPERHAAQRHEQAAVPQKPSQRTEGESEMTRRRGITPRAVPGAHTSLTRIVPSRAARTPPHTHPRLSLHLEHRPWNGVTRPSELTTYYPRRSTVPPRPPRREGEKE
ncbi:hypothetical protein B0H10DRAFT_2235014 [Mycena sp. CBHHK59/15]|nr:hypothetical protein B0H10DRAFT_2235014 [Mycena sp. CBHHK59/15]